MNRVLVSETADANPAISFFEPPPPQQYSLSQRLRSSYHTVWYRISEQLKWSHRVYHELPAGHLPDTSGSLLARIQVLQRRFDIRFEQQCSSLTALKNYDYLDILDQAWMAWGKPRPLGGVMHDIGSSNFWYARAIHAFFTPVDLTGVEVDGHRIYSNSYSRWDYAQGYIAALPQTAFYVGDYTHYDNPADTIMAWYPFVTPEPVLAWRMPLHVLAPQALFARVARNLNSAGLFVMINQGPDEAKLAADLCRRTGLQFESSFEVQHTLRRRRTPPVVSWWRRQ
ncbi:MAG: hypothetical protein HP494_15675 [Nitrospira sp.]|nr:hypothetical protein [Nitrospira sp.]